MWPSFCYGYDAHNIPCVEHKSTSPMDKSKLLMEGSFQITNKINFPTHCIRKKTGGIATMQLERASIGCGRIHVVNETTQKLSMLKNPCDDVGFLD